MAITGHSRTDATLFMTPPILVHRWKVEHRESRGASHLVMVWRAAARSFSDLQISLDPCLRTCKTRRRNATATPVFPMAANSIGPYYFARISSTCQPMVPKGPNIAVPRPIRSADTHHKGRLNISLPCGHPRSTGCVDISPQPRNPGKRHASRVTNLLACSSAKTMLVRLGTLEDAAVRQVCLTLRLRRLIAQPRVRNWNDRAQELRLLPRV